MTMKNSASAACEAHVDDRKAPMLTTGQATNTSRRRFLAAAGATLVTPPMAALGSAVETLRGGDRQLIDCQSHLFCPELVARMEKRQTDPLVFVKDGVRIVKMGDWLRKILPHYVDVDVKLAAMDAAGIERTLLSINDPGPEWFGADGPAVAQMANDFVAGIVARHPQRFVGLCVLPLQDMRASLDELDRCARQLAMKGILLYTNLAGRYPDEPEFRPLFARAVELDLPILLHPAKPVTIEQVKAYDKTLNISGRISSGVFLLGRVPTGFQTSGTPGPYIPDSHPPAWRACN